MNAGIVRGAGLLVPLLLAIAVWLWKMPNRRQFAGALLSGVWNAAMLLVVHGAARRFGWWGFNAVGGVVFGMPVDLYLGWALLWGPVASLGLARVPIVAVLVIMAGVDLLLMPACAPVIVLHDQWLIGEALALVVALLPAQLLARWTAEGRRLRERVLLQVVLFVTLTIVVLPAVILELTGTPLRLPRLSDPLESLLVQLLALLAALGLSVVQEFYLRGGGTPLPYDPPKKLVTSGLYRYLRNPMQLSMCLLLFGMGLVLRSWWVAAAGIVAAAYSAGLAAWDELSDLERRFGSDWIDYQRSVRAWWPKGRPYGRPRARIFVAMSCRPCSTVGEWLLRRNPVGLEVIAAENHPERDLERMSYVDQDGFAEAGVVAFARALEHIHFGWAFAGALMRLPLIHNVLQLLIDASGGGPQRIRRTASASW